MTTNKPEVVVWGIFFEGVLQEFGYTQEAAESIAEVEYRDVEAKVRPLIRLSDYEALKAECEKLRKDAERYKEALARISIQVDGNVRECVRDCVNGQPDVQDIYGYCDEIDSIIDAAMEPPK